MADTRRRELERQVATDPSVLGSLLREQLRAGELEPWRLDLAAYLGNSAALVATGRPLVPLPVLAKERRSSNDVIAVFTWTKGLLPQPRISFVRIAVAAARVAFTRAGRGRRHTQDANAIELLERTEAWCMAPSRKASREVSVHLAQVLPYLSDSRACSLGSFVAWFTGQRAEANHVDAEELAKVLLIGGDVVGDDVSAAVVQEVVPWALNRTDAVRERVAARVDSSSG